MLSKVIQPVWVAVMSMPPRFGAPAGVGAAAATETEAGVGAAGVGAGFATGGGGAASGARRAHAARPSAATEPAVAAMNRRRLSARMLISSASVDRAPGASHRPAR